eukprot:36647-Amphidinium_carterae.1
MAAESGTKQRDVLAAVQKDWQNLALAPKDREIVLAAVKQYGIALEFAAASCRKDREIVLAAVKQYGIALEFADASCREDREIVLAAVQQDWRALQFAAESCRGDREVVQTALKNVSSMSQTFILQWTSDELMEDSSFAIETKINFHILKISMISGRQAIVPIS